MNSSVYQGLSEDGLRDLIKDLNKRAGRAEIYTALSESHEGELLIEDMRKRVSFIRDQYRNIDSTKPEAPNLLGMMQATEGEVQGWINSLTADRKYAKQMGEQIAEITKILKSKKAVQRKDNQLAPTSVLKDMEESDGLGRR